MIKILAPVDTSLADMAVLDGLSYANYLERRPQCGLGLAACPIRSDDVRWSFSGAELVDPDTGEVRDVLLSPSRDDAMLEHYGVGERHRVFRSVTPVVLPEESRRRRIEPARKLAEAKRGLERVWEISGARAAVVQALRHAGVRATAESIRLQRDPFDGSGARVEPFADGTRFDKERLWHVEIAFGAPVGGPLLIGDGRFLGLGLMAPIRDGVPGVHAFAVTNCVAGQPEPLVVARALRRAIIARVQATVDKGKRLEPFFSGHAEDGTPVRRSRSAHLSFAFDPDQQRLLVLAPHVVERRPPTSQDLEHLRTLEVALEGFGELRAGHAGFFSLSPAAIEESDDSLLGCSRVWKSITPYVVTRHAKNGLPHDALATDVGAECRRLGLPKPSVESSTISGRPGVGLTGNLKLIFGQHISGPLLLGRTRYLGGGLFRPARDLDSANESNSLSPRGSSDAFRGPPPRHASE